MKHAQTCRCGAKIELEDDDTHRVMDSVKTWAVEHRCLPDDEGPNDRRSGVGFAATQMSSALRHPWGHNTQDVRA